MIAALLGALASAATTIFLYSDIQQLVFGSDAFYYLNIRDRILSGDIFLTAGGTQAAPVYSWFLSAIASVFGREITWIYLSQIALIALTAFLVYRLAYKIAGSKPAQLALLIYTLYLPLWIVGLEIHPQILFLSILTLAVFLLFEAADKNRKRLYLMAGFAFGLAALTRSVALYLPLALFVVLLWKQPHNWKKHLIFISAFAAVLIPWAARNSANLKDPIALDNFTIVNQAAEVIIPARLISAFGSDVLEVNWDGLLKSLAYPYRLSFVYAYGGTAPAYHYGNVFSDPGLATITKFFSQPKIIFTVMLYVTHFSLIALFLFYALTLPKRFGVVSAKEIVLVVSFLYFAASILFVPNACNMCYSYYLVPALPFMLMLATFSLITSPAKNASS